MPLRRDFADEPSGRWERQRDGTWVLPHSSRPQAGSAAPGSGSGGGGGGASSTQALYLYSTETAIADPGAGYIRVSDNLAGGNAEVAISHTDNDGNDLTAVITSFQVGDTLIFTNEEGAAQEFWYRFDLTENVAAEAGWSHLVVTLVGKSEGSTAPPADTLVVIRAVLAAGVNDHGALAGLGDDDHPQYLTTARGDARYDYLGAAGDGDAAHVAAADPHAQYLTATEGDARYDSKGTAAAGDSAHVAAADPHPQYLTSAEGDAAYDPLGAASSGDAAHVAASDPHSQYADQASVDAKNDEQDARLDGHDDEIAALMSSQTFVGTFDATNDVVASVTTIGADLGYVVGQPLPSHVGHQSEYLIVAVSGPMPPDVVPVPTPPEGVAPYLYVGDWVAAGASSWLGLRYSAREVDHGTTLGLEDDDHPQYLTTARADPLYVNIGGDTMTGSLGIGMAPAKALDAKGQVRVNGPDAGFVVGRRDMTSADTWFMYSTAGALQFYSAQYSIDRAILSDTGDLAIGGVADASNGALNHVEVNSVAPATPRVGDLWVDPNEPTYGVIPVGGVIAYGAPEAPAGWLICDGRSTAGTALASMMATTPDLRDRFVMGASAGYGVGQFGGSREITIANMPAHNHGGATSEGATTSFMRVLNAAGNAFTYNHDVGYSGATYQDYTNSPFPQHYHTLQSQGSGSHYLPMFYALAYIIRAD